MVIIGMLTVLLLYSGLLVLKAASWSFTYEVQVFGGGEITGGVASPLGMGGLTDLDALGVLSLNLTTLSTWLAASKFYPSTMAQVSTIGLEAGWAQG